VEGKQNMRRTLVAVGAGVATLALVVGLWAFQPWKAFTSSTVDEALPEAAPTSRPEATALLVPPSGPSGSGTAAPRTAVPAPSSAPAAAPPAPVVLAQGDFVDQEHDTSGVAKVVELADGSRVVRLEGFATSDGPDVHVWLTEQDAGGSWGKYDDGRYVKLGKLKGTNGNQNYPVPADADLAGLRSVVIWCDRFNVAFGSAPLRL
jgi:hypothetical protein